MYWQETRGEHGRLRTTDGLTLLEMFCPQISVGHRNFKTSKIQTINAALAGAVLADYSPVNAVFSCRATHTANPSNPNPSTPYCYHTVPTIYRPTLLLPYRTVPYC